MRQGLDLDGELGTWSVTDFGTFLGAFEDLEGLDDLVLEDLKGWEGLVKVAGATSTAGGVATVRLVPAAMIKSV